MSNQIEDQVCPCGATVTAKERKKGFREFYEFIVIGYLDRVQRVTLCTLCQVQLDRVLQGRGPR